MREGTQVSLGNMRQRGGIILSIVLSGTSAAVVVWLTWSRVVAAYIYIGVMLASGALLLLSIMQTQNPGIDRDCGDEDGNDHP
jgi:hypothetical protein